MAIEFARLRYVKRSVGGNVCRSAAYNARTDINCERTGERFYFGHRDGLLHHEIILPDGADPKFSDPGILWNAAQEAEKRKDSQEAKEILIALPANPELGLDDWKEMAAEFARENFVSKGVAVQINIHAPDELAEHADDRNIHAHILVTTRRLEGDRFASAKARDLDPEIRTLKNGRQAVTEAERWGATWRDYQNRYFERRGLDIRVEDIGFIAQTHEGPIRFRARPEDARRRAEETREANAAYARDPALVLEILTQRRATFTELDVERLLKKHIGDAHERAELRQRIIAHTSVVALHDRESGAFTERYTTEEVRAEERQVIEAASAVATKRKAVAERHLREVQEMVNLDAEQHQAFLKATGTDGLVVIEGRAGTGKSYSVNAIRAAHEKAGWRVIGLAPTNTVADDLSRAGFAEARTVHLELYYQDKGWVERTEAWNRRTVVIVDEAAMMATPVTKRLFQRAAETGAKIILVGDDRQLASVERGGMFSAIRERHGSAVISTVRRQEADWQREASTAFANGEVATGLRKYAEHGFVHWSQSLEESRARLLSDWDQNSRARPDVARFVYASTNREVNELNREIHDIRARRKEIMNSIMVETVRGRLEIGEGDRIQFHANDRKAGIFNSATGTVSKIIGHNIEVETDAGRTVRFNADRFDQFGLGYAGTVYRGQGKTQTEVYALYDNAFAWNARTAYVGLTRHQSEVNLYVSTDLAFDETVLASYMSRQMREEASLTYATKAEIIDLEKARQEREIDAGHIYSDDMAKRTTNKRKRAAEEKPQPEIAPNDPDRAAKEAGAQDERRREIAGAEHEDRQEAIAKDAEKRREDLSTESFAKAETERVSRMNAEAAEATREEQARLAEMRKTQPEHHEAFTKHYEQRAEQARGVTREHVIETMNFPASAQVRYTEALARHYNMRDPYGSLAQASLAEAAAYQRERMVLDQAIANERDDERRSMLMLRRDIEHHEHMAQVNDRLHGMSRAIGGEAHEYAALENATRAARHREEWLHARHEWAERGVDNNRLYPSLDKDMRDRIDEMRRERTPQEREERNKAREEKRDLAHERESMRRMDLPGYAERAHGYQVEWGNETHTRATLTRGDEMLRASRLEDGTWSYRSEDNIRDKGDIINFEATRRDMTFGEAQKKLRTALEQAERDHGGPLYQRDGARERQREREERERDGWER